MSLERINVLSQGQVADNHNLELMQVAHLEKFILHKCIHALALLW